VLFQGNAVKKLQRKSEIDSFCGMVSRQRMWYAEHEY